MADRLTEAARTADAQIAWIERVDRLLVRADAAIGRARCDDAPLVARVALFVEIAATRARLAAAWRAARERADRG